MPKPTAIDELRLLLLRSFSAEEIRRFLHYGPNGDILIVELPGATASPSDIAASAINALRHFDLLDMELKARLIEQRPRRAAEFERVFAQLQKEGFLSAADEEGGSTERVTVERVAAERAAVSAKVVLEEGDRSTLESDHVPRKL